MGISGKLGMGPGYALGENECLIKNMGIIAKIGAGTQTKAIFKIWMTLTSRHIKNT